MLHVGPPVTASLLRPPRLLPLNTLPPPLRGAATGVRWFQLHVAAARGSACGRALEHRQSSSAKAVSVSLVAGLQVVVVEVSLVAGLQVVVVEKPPSSLPWRQI